MLREATSWILLSSVFYLRPFPVTVQSRFSLLIVNADMDYFLKKMKAGGLKKIRHQDQSSKYSLSLRGVWGGHHASILAVFHLSHDPSATLLLSYIPPPCFCGGENKRGCHPNEESHTERSPFKGPSAPRHGADRQEDAGAAEETEPQTFFHLSHISPLFYHAFVQTQGGFNRTH